MMKAKIMSKELFLMPLVVTVLSLARLQLISAWNALHAGKEA